MHILCIHQFYGSPDGPGNSRHWTFFEHLIKEHEITLICNKRHTKSSLKEEVGFVPKGVKVIYVDAPYDNAMNPEGRLKAYLHFAKEAFRLGLKVKNVDIVWGVTVPLTTAFVGILLANWKKVKSISEIKDLWPDFPIQMGGLKNPLLQKMAYWMEKYVYQKANHIICTSPDYTKRVLQIAPNQKVDTLFLGTNFAFIDEIKAEAVLNLRRQYNLEGKKVILYGGTFGRSNAIPELIQVIQHLQSHPEIVFVFFGVGYYQERLVNLQKEYANLLVLPPQMYKQSLQWFKLADIGLVSFIDIPVLATNSPAKFFDSLGCGTPVIVNTKGWTKVFVEANECGVFSKITPPELFVTTLIDILSHQKRYAFMQKNAQEAARTHFNLSQISISLSSILKNL